MISISNDAKVIEEAINGVQNQLFAKDEQLLGLIYLLNNSTEQYSRFRTDCYNSLAFFLLELYLKNRSFAVLKAKLDNEVKFKSKDELDFIYQLFIKAKNLSRNTEFAKADAYTGLKKIRQYQIANKLFTSEGQYQTYMKDIDEYTKACNEINNKLKRPNT